MQRIHFLFFVVLFIISGQSSFADNSSNLQLTQSEKAWLVAHPVIRVGMDAEYAPYEWLDKNGNYMGMAVDYLRLLEIKLGIRFEILKGKSWKEIVEMGKKGEIDILTSIVQTPKRLEYFIFSAPYRETQTMIVDNGEGEFIGNLKNLEGKRVSLEKGYFTQELLTENYPKIKIIPANNILEALDFVIKGKADAYVGDMSAINYAIKNNGLEYLRFSGQTEYSSQHRFAFPKSNIELASIIDKAMVSISTEESNAIFNRWIGVKIEQGVKVETIIKYSIGLFLLLVLFGYFYFRLHREIAHRKASEKLYKHLTEDIMDVVWSTDANFHVTYISPSDERLRGFKAEEVIGQHVFEMFTPEGIAIVMEKMRQRQEFEKNGIFTDYTRFKVQHKCKDGRVIWGEVLSRPERDKQGKIIGYHGTTREITEQQEMQDKVEQLAFYDVLTKLPNRFLLNEHLHKALANSKRNGKYCALMFLDLDNFKSLNDTQGHTVGDLLLYQVADRLKNCVREIDTVARFGGDEFIVLLNALDEDKSKSIQYAHEVAEKIRLSLAKPYVLNTDGDTKEDKIIEHSCTASIGILVFDGKERNEDDILKYADMAMYKAKDMGKNSIYFYNA